MTGKRCHRIHPWLSCKPTLRCSCVISFPGSLDTRNNPHHCATAQNKCRCSLLFPGHLLSVMDNLRPASPQGEGMLHVYALEAACHARADKKGCEDALFCLWDTKTVRADAARTGRAGSPCY